MTDEYRGLFCEITFFKNLEKFHPELRRNLKMSYWRVPSATSVASTSSVLVVSQPPTAPFSDVEEARRAKVNAYNRVWYAAHHARARAEWAAHLTAKRDAAAAAAEEAFNAEARVAAEAWAAANAEGVRRAGAAAAAAKTATEAEAEVPREMCPVCYCEPADFIPSCGHATCSACAIGMLRAACDDQRSALTASGFACVQRCEHRIGPNDVESLLTDLASSRLRAIRGGAPDPGAQFGGRGADGALGLSYEEYERFRQFVLEASIPFSERVHCPGCARASARADVTTDGGGGGTRGLCCPHCQHRWRPDAADTQGPSTTATDAYIDATGRRCPSCDVPITKWHGHCCHHISPQTNGCPNCHQHFCYVCLRKHGRPSPRGRSSEFHNECVHTRTSCHTTRHAHRMRPHISMSPYPHDVRCGCPICPDCRKGMPCELCEGNCVVCHGLVDPGPTQLAQPVAACTVQGCVVHDDRQARRRRREWE